MRNVTAINPSAVRAIASKLGLSIKEKKGEFKVFGPAGIKHSIAVPCTKLATRIYLVGFESKVGTCPHPKPPAATVTQMFDHSLPEKELLRAIFAAAKALASVTEEAKPTKLQLAAVEAEARYQASLAA